MAVKLLSPKLPPSLEPVLDFPNRAAALLQQELPLSDALIEHVVLTGADLSGLVLEEVHFRSCRLLECDCSRWELTDVVFQDCDLSGSRFFDGIWSRVLCLDCRALEAGLSQCGLQHVQFFNCKLSDANCAGQRIQYARWKDCALSRADFSSSRWRRVTLEGCDLTGARLFQTPLAGVDLTTCRLDGLVLSQEGDELRGAIVDRWQASELAKRLGLIVRD